MTTLSAPVPGSAVLPEPAVRRPALAVGLLSDARLARLAATGSQAAMAEIFERHHQALHRYCYSILGNGHDAADALQNTMIKALRALPGETRRIALRPWLYRIAHNESISLLRARRPDVDLDEASHVGDPAAAGLVESRERLRSLTEDLTELTERQRGALLMRELGGLDFTEVADALGTSASAVKQSVYEARCALQAMEEGRAMDCEAVRRTLSDGDRRMLRGMRMRGHLRACAGCHDFEQALRLRPAQLTAMIPPLPVGVAAAMLHGLLGGAGSSAGGGLASGLAATAKATTGATFGAKAAAVVAASATLAGGAVYAVPKLESARSTHSSSRSQPAVAGNARRAITTRPGVAERRPLSPIGAGAASGSSREGARPAEGTDAIKGGTAGLDRPAGASGGKLFGSVLGTVTGTAGGRPSVLGRPAGAAGARASGAAGPVRTRGHRTSGAGNSAHTAHRSPPGTAGASAATPAAGSGAGRISGTDSRAAGARSGR